MKANKKWGERKEGQKERTKRKNKKERTKRKNRKKEQKERTKRKNKKKEKKERWGGEGREGKEELMSFELTIPSSNLCFLHFSACDTHR